MANQRSAKEKVDKLDVSVITSPIDSADKVLVADVHNRQGTILSDRRTGAERHVARYDEDQDKEWYPVGNYCNSSTVNPLNVILLTALAPVDVFLPEAGAMNEIEFMYVDSSAFAGNRELAVVLFDGANQLPIYLSGAAALPTNTDGLIHPTDELLAGAVFPGTRNTFKVRAGAYIYCTAIGLVAAEQIAIMVHNIAYDVGGLRD